MTFMKGILILDVPRPLSQGSGPTKSQRNALSLYDLEDFSTRTYLWMGKLVSKGVIRMKGS